jgi:hypothetical protein
MQRIRRHNLHCHTCSRKLQREFCGRGKVFHAVQKGDSHSHKWQSTCDLLIQTTHVRLLIVELHKLARDCVDDTLTDIRHAVAGAF